MEKLIRLRGCLESLTAVEFKSFMELFDRETMTTIIFRGLLHQLHSDPSCTQSQANLDMYLFFVKYLLNQRKKDENSSVFTAPSATEQAGPVDVNLDDLPNVLLSAISSFLEFEDDLNFQKTNRTIFVGARSSPWPLHSLDPSMCRELITFRHNHSSSFLPQPIFKSVSIDCQDLVERRHQNHEDGEWSAIDDFYFEPSGLEFIKKARSLKIDIGSMNYDDARKPMEAAESVFHNIIMNQTKYFRHLTKLHILCGDEDFDDCMPFLDRMVRKSNLQYLEYDGQISDDNGFTNYKWARKLKGIAFCANWTRPRLDELAISRKVHSALTDKLESLHVVERMINDDFKGKLANLKELCIRNGHNPEIENHEGYRMLLNENMHELKRLCFIMQFRNDSQINEPFVSWLLKAMITVEYLSFNLFLYCFS